MSKYLYLFMSLFLILFAAVLIAGCARGRSTQGYDRILTPDLAPTPSNFSPATPPTLEPTPTLPPGTLYQSDRYHLQAILPSGWAAAEGPQHLARPFTGLMAFNSWGQAGFWAVQVVQGDHAEYSPASVFSQMPPEGIYVALVEMTGGPIWGEYGPEYAPDDLSGILDGPACQEKTSGEGSSLLLSFFKWARQFRLEVYCGPEAAAGTQSSLESLLESWRFDRVPAGDVGWAMVAASRQLPQIVEPDKFIVQSREVVHSTRQEGDVLREVYAGLGNESDGTIYVDFKYQWDYQPLVQSLADCPEKSCHTWSFQVKPDGEVSLMGEWGAPLPEPDRSTSTPLPPLPTLSPGVQPPPFLYFSENQILEILPGVEPRAVATLPELGKVHTAVPLGGEVILLRERGVQRVDLLARFGENLVEFEAPMLFGDLLADPQGKRVFYSATFDSGCTGENGFGSRVGYYDASLQAHIPLRSDAFSIRLLGPSADGHSLFLLPVGCDPSFGPVWSVALENGQKEKELSTQGENLTHLSPDGRYFATLHARTVDPEKPLVWILAIYDLKADPATLRESELPEPGGYLWYMFWSPGSRWLYFPLLSQDLNDAGAGTDTFGLWRLSVATGKITQVAPGRPGSMPQLDQNGKWLLLRYTGSPTAYLVDMEAGQASERILPYPAIPGFTVQGTEFPSWLSRDGNWLLVWHRQGTASVTHLPTGSLGLITIPEGATLVGWR